MNKFADKNAYKAYVYYLRFQRIHCGLQGYMAFERFMGYSFFERRVLMQTKANLSHFTNISENHKKVLATLVEFNDTNATKSEVLNAIRVTRTITKDEFTRFYLNRFPKHDTHIGTIPPAHLCWIFNIDKYGWRLKK